jgi:hypothetical protein
VTLRGGLSGYASLPAGQDRLQFLNAPRYGWHASCRVREQADVAQLVEHHLAKVRVAGSNPVVRSEVPEAVSRADGQLGSSAPVRLRRGRLVAEWPSGLGKGLQSPVRGFDSRFRLDGRLAQRESASLTRKRPLVQSQYRPPGQLYYSNTHSLIWLTRKSQSRAIRYLPQALLPSALRRISAVQLLADDMQRPVTASVAGKRHRPLVGHRMRSRSSGLCPEWTCDG